MSPYSKILIHFSQSDPLGQGIGGGMIFDPFAGNALRPRIGPRPNLPPGMLPPGARYDPVGPIPDDIFFRYALQIYLHIAIIEIMPSCFITDQILIICLHLGLDHEISSSNFEVLQIKFFFSK